MTVNVQPFSLLRRKSTLFVSIILFGSAFLALAWIGLSADTLSVSASTDESCCLKNGTRTFDVPPPADLTPKLAQVEEHIPYMFLFQYVSAIDANKKGADMLKELRVKSKFSQGEFDKLVAVAHRYKHDVDEYDKQAKVIIDEFHRQYPPGKLPAGTGPGKPPEQLAHLQKQRNDAALRYRDEARRQLDNAKFDEFLKSEIHPKVGRKKQEAQ